MLFAKAEGSIFQVVAEMEETKTDEQKNDAKNLKLFINNDLGFMGIIFNTSNGNSAI